jgi:hypothetical protein
MTTTLVLLQTVRKQCILKQYLSIVGVQEVRMDGAESSIEIKRKAIEEVKRLTNHGKHMEASKLFNTHFPNFGGPHGKS